MTDHSHYSEDLARALERINGRDPRRVQWECEDGWIVGYTTEKFGTHASPLDSDDGEPGTGKFGFFVYKPLNATEDVLTYELVRHRYMAKRKDAKRLALNEYWKRCPAKRARNEQRGFNWDNKNGSWVPVSNADEPQV